MNNKLKEIAIRIEQNPRETLGHIYHPLPFPEFDHLKTSSSAKTAYSKWNLITQALPPSPSYSTVNILDVGANAGFYSFSFAKGGAKVDAFEPHEYYADIGREIASAASLQVQWHNKPLEADNLVDKKYDVALMLSVFQWMSQGDKYLPEATSLLQLVAASTSVLFFELGCNQGKSAISTTERPVGWIWRLLSQTAAPKQVSFLGTTTAWGKARRYLFACSDFSLRLTHSQRLVTYLLQKQWVS